MVARRHVLVGALVVSTVGGVAACGNDDGESVTTTVTEKEASDIASQKGRAADLEELSTCLRAHGFTAVRPGARPTNGVAGTSPAGSKFVAATGNDPLLARAIVREYRDREPPPTIGADVAPDGLTALVVTPRDDEALRLASECLPGNGDAAPAEPDEASQSPDRPGPPPDDRTDIEGTISAAVLFELRRNSIALQLDRKGLKCLSGDPTLPAECDGYAQARTCVKGARSDQEIVECVAHGEYAVTHARCLGEAIGTGGSIGACDGVARQAEQRVLEAGRNANSQEFALSEQEAIQRGFNEAIGSHFGGFGRADCVRESPGVYTCSGTSSAGSGVWTAELRPGGDVIYRPR